MSNVSLGPPVGQPDSERSPLEAALMLRLRVFLTMRWFVIIGVVAITWAAGVFGIGFATLPVYIIAGLMLVYNVVLMYQVRGLKTLRSDLVMPRIAVYGFIHIVLDLLAFTTLLHFTGGIENPFLFFGALHIIGGSTLLRRRWVFSIAVTAFLMVTLLVMLEYMGVIPHVNLEGFVAAELYRDARYIVAALVALAGISTATAYMTTAISGELRKQQRQVVMLRERRLDETTGELNRITQEVSKLREEKDRFLRFLSVAAHDMKAPLAAIQSYFGVMLGGFSGPLTEKQKSMMERSSARITELLKLISDLLDIPRIETGQLVPEMKEVSVPQVVTGCIDEMRDLAKEKGLKLSASLPPTLPAISGSAPRLQQVMTNLVNNAICYTSQGEVTVKVTDRDNDILVEVVDTGIGIPAEDLPKVFSDFFRASNVPVKGTGLGLSISKRIVEAHGGKIWVESPCPGSQTGSRFSFTLPKRSDGRQSA